MRGRAIAVVGSVAGVAACHVAAAAYVAQHDPYSTEIFAPCPILAMTGWQCPGCGGTRALFSLLHGDVAASFAMNPLLLSLYVTAGLVVAAFVSTAKARPRLGNGLAFTGLAVVVIAAVYAGVVRNLIGG